MKVITITNENREEQAELVGDLVVSQVLVGNGEKYLYCREPDEEVKDPYAIDPDDYKRDVLDDMAEKLDLEPDDYRTKGDIAEAISEAAKSAGKLPEDLIE